MLRIEQLYWPYHAELGGLIERTRRRFGLAVLIDCHSMPSNSCEAAGGGTRAHFVLGDRFGAACAPELTKYVEGALRGFGYEVAINQPYAGGYITEHYGAPAQGVHALQLEVNRALFTDEARLELTGGFAPLREHLMQLVTGLAEFSRCLQPMRAAAE